MTTHFRPVRHVRAYERVVEQIEEAIVSGEFQPGQHLPSERDLVEQLGVSRSTVREALRVLESGGLTRSRPGDPNGAEVLPLSSDGVTRSMEMIAKRTKLGLADLLRFRMLIEGNLCELVAKAARPESLAELDLAMEAMSTSIDEGAEPFIAADLDFHRTVARVAGDPLLLACHEVILGLVREMVAGGITRAEDSRAQMLETLSRHQAVLAAIKDGDARRAVNLTRRHQLDYYGDLVPSPERQRLERLAGPPVAEPS